MSVFSFLSEWWHPRMCLRPCVRGDTTQCRMASGCWCPRVCEKTCGSSGTTANPRSLSDAHSPPAARGEASLAASAALAPASCSSCQGNAPVRHVVFFLLLEIAPRGHVYLLWWYLCSRRRRLHSCNADKSSEEEEEKVF